MTTTIVAAVEVALEMEAAATARAAIRRATARSSS
jgi:hypothetical protein